MSRLHRWMVVPAGVMLLLGALVSGGCQLFESDSSSSSSSAAEGEARAEAEAVEEEEVVYDPQEGMTKAEIQEMYRGEPDQRSVGSDGTEVWTYHVNAGEAWIPFNFGYRPRFHQIHFNSEGVVERYTRDD